MFIQMKWKFVLTPKLLYRRLQWLYLSFPSLTTLQMSFPWWGMSKLWLKWSVTHGGGGRRQTPAWLGKLLTEETSLGLHSKRHLTACRHSGRGNVGGTGSRPAFVGGRGRGWLHGGVVPERRAFSGSCSQRWRRGTICQNLRKRDAKEGGFHCMQIIPSWRPTFLTIKALPAQVLYLYLFNPHNSPTDEALLCVCMLSHQSERKSVLNIHWKDWCWSSSTLATWCEELTHWKRPWRW